ncbi:MAG: helix-turn-helix transcriptional regulator [Sulfuricellaceae bacterium]|jgi:DNA-binding NarL/FixJ family response regulator
MTTATDANIAVLCQKPERDKSLSLREQSVLQGLLEGMTDGEIAAMLGVSEKTVSYHMRHLIAKLGARNRTYAVIQALRMSLLNLD